MSNIVNTFSYKPCYLPELDSVRNSDEQVKLGIEALARVLAAPENYVVLPFNQLGDSKTVISCFMDEDSGADFIALFESGRIKVNRFESCRTVISYLTQKMDKSISSDNPTKAFVFSAVEPFKKPYLGDGTLESDSRLKKVLAEMKVALESNDAAAFASGSAGAALLEEEDRAYIERYVNALLRISVVPALYVGPKAGPGKTDFGRVFPIALEELRACGEELAGMADSLEAIRNGQSSPNDRSPLHVAVGEELRRGRITQRQASLMIGIVDAVYNHVVRSSIEGLDFDEAAFREEVRQLVCSYGGAAS